jgi:ATP-dependent DNA helicase RecQ
MKDQVDNLSRMGISDAVTINGMLNPVERSEAIERVSSGIASILYISPESLRSRTMERLLISRNVVRFVIDEAHCFSAWGQDFRVDYLYIGDFISKLQKIKQCEIPVSCFTATAKQKVISDIRVYFQKKLNINLELYTTNASRTNLRYEVLYKESDQDKYIALRNIIEQKNCPTIVYVSRTKRTYKLAEKLSCDGFEARAFNGKMDSHTKVENQDAFIKGDVQIIVATSAFGMGVDKKDVGLVVHYDISDSLENYVQEAGRAGRDEHISAECYILFCDQDLDKHFILLNQTKLSISEIQQVWRGIKELTRDRKKICSSPLEIARKAGWDDTVSDIETKVKTAVTALENAGYIKRGQNVPRVYANSIRAKNAAVAIAKINDSLKFDEKQKENATRIIQMLVASKYRNQGKTDEAEKRVDYIADILGLTTHSVIESVNLMREADILADDTDMTAFFRLQDLKGRTKNNQLNNFIRLENFLMERLDEAGNRFDYKEQNDAALKSGLKFSTVSMIKQILFYWTISGYIKKSDDATQQGRSVIPQNTTLKLKERREKRTEIANFVYQYLNKKAEQELRRNMSDNVYVNFSVLELKKAYENELTIFGTRNASLKEIEEALLFLSKIDVLSLEGGFIVSYNRMEIVRLEMDNRIQYKKDDYKELDEFYKSRAQQIHIVGEYANMMVRSYDEALIFVNDYFQMDYRLFLQKYFKGDRLKEIDRNITPTQYKKLFEGLSSRQAEVIADDETQYIVVAAGPGSGKTKILVHKLASLLQMEDVKSDQLLMLTFSRAAANEFKTRLMELIGNAAHFVKIKTFHSFAFEILGKIGDLEQSGNIVREATELIHRGEADPGMVAKKVVVIDEAQDMDKDEFGLVQELIARNDDMRVIAVGDDDQNIYAFRGSDSKYMRNFLTYSNSKMYEMVDNYRSCKKIVELSNWFVESIGNRMKSTPISAVKEEPGRVIVTHCNTRYIENIILKIVRNTFDEEKTACVLTNTNDEALRVAGILLQHGHRARLIQNNMDFKVSNLTEIDFFVKQLNQTENVGAISKEEWKAAKKELQKKYERSTSLGNCLELLKKFENENKNLYMSDFRVYLQEVGYEDFTKAGKNEILVSTIHKAKGREFDIVYMLLDGQIIGGDEDRRKLYVGMTRAKEQLYICLNKSCILRSFSESKEINYPKGIEAYIDSSKYDKPAEIVMQLNYKDVNLGYFESDRVQQLMWDIQSGDDLEVHIGNIKERETLFLSKKIYGVSQRVFCCSKDFYKKVERVKEDGYTPDFAKVRFALRWRDNTEEKFYDIILPDIHFKKISPCEK